LENDIFFGLCKKTKKYHVKSYFEAPKIYRFNLGHNKVFFREILCANIEYLGGVYLIFFDNLQHSEIRFLGSGCWSFDY
jgi:hypothetical protein